MFEEEAKEYTSNLLKDVNCNIGNPRTRQINSIDIEDTFKYAAEFGYNKGFEFGVKSSEKVNQIVDNEWHYVKDGDLPDSNKDKYYFVFDKSYEPMIARFYCGKWSNYSVIDDVIAWKEIVLPELKESE